MSLHDAVQNAVSPSLVDTGTLVCIVTVITILLCCCMSKAILPASNTKALFRLLLELTLLAIVSFSAAVIVLSIFHTRIEQRAPILGDLGAITEEYSTGPLGFTSTRGT